MLSKNTPTPAARKPSATARGTAKVPFLMRPMRWARGLLNSRLRMERRGLQIHVLLEPARPKAAPVAPDSRNGEVLRLAHAELRELLDRHGDTRHVLPHLSFVEQALAKSGSRAIGRVPLPVLEKALIQLENLIHDSPGDGLAELRRRLLASITMRSDKGPVAPSVDMVSDFQSEERLEVTEASHSLFDEMERSWSGTIPAELSAPAD